MNKVQLIQALKDATDLTKPQAAAVVDIFFNGMADELAKGGRVEIRGFCSFFVKEYIANDYFDIVCCSHALYELKGQDRNKALLEMYRVARPNGKVLIMEHEVPKKRLVKILFNIRMLMMGPTNTREFINQSLSPFTEIFSNVKLSHKKSGKSKLITCRKG